ncbi:hypothetical protein [Nonomuraea ceibae]|uniref:hypothetical protein n=1 Tax=Nonomuraea ceibae TaxID=1935170 RepID=UPI001C5D1D39|nr:hypothetical protein [Nonomuraea ceibae]
MVRVGFLLLLVGRGWATADLTGLSGLEHSSGYLLLTSPGWSTWSPAIPAP